MKKVFRSKNYNYNFDMETGFLARWGKTYEDDPQRAPVPEILDIEVTTICKGPGGKPCPFCYKSNTPTGYNMSLDEFKTILDKMPFLTQVAFGVDAQAESNPDLFDMMAYCREKQIIPNLTVADISDETAEKIHKYAGAVAVSRYADKNICYDSIERLVKTGMKQVNMHIMVSEETYDHVIETLEDYHFDPRLKDMNAIVLLSLKRKGRGVGYTPLAQEKFSKLVQMGFDLKVPFGFDSCSANKFVEVIKDRPDKDKLEMLVEPCESTLFSSYINEKGIFYPCSFCEEGEGLDVLACEDFARDIWNHSKTLAFVEKLQNNCRHCPVFEV
jgi:hypothetical protein